MTLSPQLLEILVCPVTKLPVSPLTEAQLSKLNSLIESGNAVTRDDNPVTEKIDEALITNNQKTIYRIQEGIPIMLEDQGISVEQFDNW